MNSGFKSLSIDSLTVSRWTKRVREYGFPSWDTGLYSLSPAQAIAEVQSAQRPINDPFVLGSMAAQATTPSTLTAALSEFGRPGGPDAVLVELGREAIETDPDRHMPVKGRRNPDKPFGFDEIALLAIIQSVGFPMALLPEAGLDLIMPVSPTPGLEATRSSKGGAQLGWHVDNIPFLPGYRPDCLALMGLVATEPVVTSFVLIDDVLAALRKHGPHHERILRRSLFRYATPASFHLDGSSPVMSNPMPMIDEDHLGRPVFNFNEYTLVADRDPEVTATLAVLSRVLLDPAVVREVCISPGKVLLLSNTRALHARGEVRGKRYLARLYGKRDLSALRALPSGGDRVCRFRFSMTPGEMVAACLGPEPHRA